MNGLDCLSIAAKQIKKSVVRSILTVLGIVIGISSMITVLSVGDAGKSMITTELNKLGINRIWLFADDANGAAASLKVEDVELLSKHVSNIQNISPSAYNRVSISHGSKEMVIDIVGTNDQVEEIEGLEMLEGRYISQRDIDYERQVIVLGESAGKELFGDASALGEEVEVNGKRYTVIGVEKETKPIYGSFFEGKSYIPITAYENTFGTDELYEISLTAEDDQEVDAVMNQAVDVIVDKYGENSIKVLNMSKEMQSAENILDIFKLVITAIAAISLIVGGIGIMNIMLVTVKERTREIGIRKALGAKNKDILGQFLAEALLYAVIGAAIGIAFGLGLAYLASTVMGATLTISLGSILFSVVFAVTIGMVFGILPARKAAKLDPVEALRQ